MTMLSVRVLDAKPSAQTAAPGVTFRLRVETISPGAVHAIALRCQTRIEPKGRRYAKDEQARLYELFGDVSQWERTLRSATWAHTTILIPSFERQVEVDMPVACTYDLEVASAKYLHAVRDGEVPLTFFFSGSIFRIGPSGMVVEPVSWDLEASFRMPTCVWRAAMDQFFPGGGWIRLDRETIDRLQAFRGRQAVVSWDEAITLLLAPTQVDQTV
ncbi:MAG TPA: DUF6084 family protein [Vicinamibacterales bacterium]|jgi:hypothetical protein|nr:DUF6084 family protein [Vicinamibacterales bacterium]